MVDSSAVRLRVPSPVNRTGLVWMGTVGKVALPDVPGIDAADDAIWVG